MNTPDARSASAPRITPAQWDDLRGKFKDSLLAETSIAALADNIDGCQWPKKGPEEIPATYLALSHGEVVARFASLRLSPSHFDKLADILRGTLAFDESFGEMAEVAGRAEAENDPLKRNLKRLGIPEDFPTALCNFTPYVHNFCQAERLEVIADFLSYARNVARAEIVAGEFRELLNACVHIDERVLAHHLPFRLKTTGLHLVEGLAHVVRAVEPGDRGLLRQDPAAALPPELRAQADGLVRYFHAEFGEIVADHYSGTPPARLVAVLDAPDTEADVAALLTLYLPAAAPVNQASEREIRSGSAQKSPAESQAPEKKSGLFQRLFGRR